MQSKEVNNGDAAVSLPNVTTSTQVVTAESVQAEEVPTIPLDSLETISTLQPEVSIHPVAATRAVSVPVPLVVQPSGYRRSMSEWLQVWWDGIRPAYLLLALLPVLVGTVIGWTQTFTATRPLGHFHVTHFLVTCFAIIALQAGANLINDYYDYLRGVDTSNALGPGGLIQQGLMKPTRVLLFGLSLLGIGALFGAVVALAGGVPVYLFGLIGLLCAYFYSATKRSLTNLVLGEIATFLIYGPLITMGAYMVQIQSPYLGRSAFLYSIPLGLLAVAVVHVNNMRDVEGDAQAGRRTVATSLGWQWSRVFAIVLLLAAYACIIAMGLPKGSSHWILLTLWTLPPLVVIITGIWRTDTPAGLHLVMLQTIRLETYFTVLLLVALFITALVPVAMHIPARLIPVP